MDNHGRTLTTLPSRHFATARGEVPRPRSRRLRRFLAKYVKWTEFFGYAFIILVTIAIAFCWFYQVDEVCKADGNPAIKPYTEILKHTADVIVTRILVKEHQNVKKGQPLVEVCADKKWLDRHKAMTQTENALKELRKLAGQEKAYGGMGVWEYGSRQSPPYSHTPTLPYLITTLEQRVANWKEEWKRAPKKTLRSPIAGRVTGAKDLEGKEIAANKDILKVVDLNNLRITVKLLGTNVEDVRVEQEAKIEVVPNYGSGAVLRADTRLMRWRGFRLVLNELLDGKELKKSLSEQLKGLKITTRKDIVLEATEVSELSFDASVQTERITPQQAQGKEQSAVEEFHKLELKGMLIEGKHVSNFTIKELPEKVQKELQKKIAEALKGKRLLAHEERQSLWGRVRGEKPQKVLRGFSVEELETLIPTLKLKVELTEPADTKKQEKWEEQWRKDWYEAIRGERADRAYEGVVRLKDPPQELKDKVWELMTRKEPQNIATTTWVVTNRRRLALMLFKQ